MGTPRHEGERHTQQGQPRPSRLLRHRAERAEHAATARRLAVEVRTLRLRAAARAAGPGRRARRARAALIAAAARPLASGAHRSAAAALVHADAFDAHLSRTAVDHRAIERDAKPVDAGLPTRTRKLSGGARRATLALDAERRAGTLGEVVARAIAIVVEAVADLFGRANAANAGQHAPDAVLLPEFALSHIGATLCAALWIIVVDRAVAIVVEPIAQLHGSRGATVAHHHPVLTDERAGCALADIRSTGPARVDGVLVDLHVAVVVQQVANLGRRALPTDAHHRPRDALLRAELTFPLVRAAAVAHVDGVVVDGVVAVVVEPVAELHHRADASDTNQGRALALEHTGLALSDVGETARPPRVGGLVVHQPITVVVEAVAYFGGRHARRDQAGHLHQHVFEVVVAASEQVLEPVVVGERIVHRPIHEVVHVVAVPVESLLGVVDVPHVAELAAVVGGGLIFGGDEKEADEAAVVPTAGKLRLKVDGANVAGLVGARHHFVERSGIADVVPTEGVLEAGSLQDVLERDRDEAASHLRNGEHLGRDPGIKDGVQERAALARVEPRLHTLGLERNHLPGDLFDDRRGVVRRKCNEDESREATHTPMSMYPGHGVRLRSPLSAVTRRLTRTLRAAS